jgi:hypothetical protein
MPLAGFAGILGTDGQVVREHPLEDGDMLLMGFNQVRVG